MISYMLICLSVCFLIVEVGSTPIPLPESSDSQSSPEGRQGILEVPKQAATVIRNFIDRNLHNYLNIPTPVPQRNVPAELKDSIVGNLLIAGLNSWRPLPPSYTFYPQTQPSTVSEVTTTTVANEVTRVIQNQNTNVESVTVKTVNPPRSSPRESPSQVTTNTQIFSVTERITTPRPKPTQAGSVEVTTKEDEEEGSFEEEEVLIRKKKY